MAALRILINGQNVTAYSLGTEDKSKRTGATVQDKLHIPVYFLAEWIAENWWSLLYEPRKTESSDDTSFYSRHSILQAQHGFALPNVQIEPLGEAIRVSCRAREASLPGVRFQRSAAAFMNRETIETILKEFLKNCVDRLGACQIKGTPFERAWLDIQQTAQSEIMFCKLVGALGVNPYGASDEIAGAVERIYDSVGEIAALDLCMASSEEEVLALGATAAVVAEKLKGAHESTLAPLANLHLPPDNISIPSWRRGNNTALTVRRLIGISTDDQLGADKLLDALKISTKTNASLNDTDEEAVVTGAVDRIDDVAAFVLLQSREEARRFAASRAIFLTMSSEVKSTRLVTDAMTRDQQASRAFAAEMLVPFDYIRSQARGRRLPRDEIHEIARRRRASVDVVTYQAINNGLIVEAL